MRNFGYDAGDGQSVADFLVHETATIVAAEARRFVAVAAYADCYGPEAHTPTGVPGEPKLRTFGGDGTPEVLGLTSQEVGALLGRSPVAGSHQLQDALDVRHRHPQTWARLLETCTADAPGVDPALAAGMVQVWQARAVAKACHTAGLTLEQARWVDAEITPLLGHLPWSTLLNVLAERIIAADPDAAEARRADEERRAYVAAGQANEHGMKTLVANARAGDVIALLAMLDLLAGCLKTDGVDGTRDELRAHAVGIIANPATALTLLLRHAIKDQTPASVEPAEPTPSDETTSLVEPLETTHDDALPLVEPVETIPLVEPVETTRSDVEDLFADRRIDPREADAGPPPGTDPRDTDSLDPDDRPPDDDPRVSSAPDCSMRHLGGVEGLAGLLALLGMRIDPTRLTPKRVLYLHLNESSFDRDRNGAVRFEDEQPITGGHLLELLAGTRVTLKPVIDLANTRSVERYEVPDDLREAVQLSAPRSLSPWAPTSSRATSVDMDHAQEYDPDATADDAPDHEPQTRLDNLGPLHRGAHRLKTHQRGWTCRQPRPGVRYWRSRHGYVYRVDPTGTHPLGKHDMTAFQAGVDADHAAHLNGHDLDITATLAAMRDIEWLHAA